MYQVNHVIKLDGKKFYEASVWNMFCRKKMMSVLLIIIFGMGLSSVVTSLPSLKTGDVNGFVMGGGLGIIMLVMDWYMVYSNLGRLKRMARNEEYLDKTEKHIKMNEDQIINYRVSVSEQISYTWNQVEAMYDLKDDIVFSFKDKQILLFEKAKLEPKELEFIRAKADVKDLWKKAVDIRIWYLIIAVIALISAGIGAALWFA